MDTTHEPLLQFFDYAHLQPHLQPVAYEFFKTAHYVVSTLPRNTERTVALRKLVEAKDAAVRTLILK